MAIELLRTTPQAVPSIIELLAAKRAQIWRESAQLDDARIALDDDTTEASLLALRIKWRMDNAIIDEDTAICEMLSHERPKSLSEVSVMLKALEFYSWGVTNEDDEAVRDARADARERIIEAIQAALPPQPEADPGRFGIEMHPDTATLLAEAARLTARMEPTDLAAHDAGITVAAA
jgi:hypothetical protein